MTLRWTLINQPNVYGYFTRVGELKAEVVRAYTSDWRIFLYRGETMIRADAVLELDSYQRSYPSHLRAKEAAAQLLAALDTDENRLPVPGTGLAPR